MLIHAHCTKFPVAVGLVTNYMLMSVILSFPFVLLCRRCDIRSRVELMSYAVLHCATLVFLGGCYITRGPLWRAESGRAYSLTSLWVGLPPVIWFRLPLRSTRLKALSAPALHLQAVAKVGKGFLSDQLVTGAASSDIVQAAT